MPSSCDPSSKAGQTNKSHISEPPNNNIQTYPLPRSSKAHSGEWDPLAQASPISPKRRRD